MWTHLDLSGLTMDSFGFTRENFEAKNSNFVPFVKGDFKMNEHLQSEISDFRHLMEGRIWPMGSSEHQPVTGCLAQMALEANSEVKAESKFGFVLSGEKLGF